jgi:hypothetical protein
MRITAVYTDGITFQMRGKGVTAAALRSTQTVQLAATSYQRRQDQQVVDLLDCIRLLLVAQLNHLREITSIEADRGNDY